MSLLRDIGKGFRVLRRSGRHALYGSLATATSLFRSRDDESKRVFLHFLRHLFTFDGELAPGSEELFCRTMEECRADVNADQLWQELENTADCGEKESVRELLTVPAEKREGFFRFAAAMVHGREGILKAAERLAACARGTGMDEEHFQKILDDIALRAERRREMLRSGAGIVAALIVIAVFILTATLLRSVIFGLIAAYLLLPVEQHLEKSWRRKKGLGFYLGTLSSWLWWLPRKLASVLLRRDGDNAPTPEQLAKKEEQQIISRAVGQTVLAVLAAVALLAGGTYMLSSYYLRGIGENVKHALVQESPPQPAAAGTAQTAAAPAKQQLQAIREKISSVPFLKYLLEKAETQLRDEHTRSELTAMLWRRSGGVFSFLFNLMGFVGTLLCDLLLTLFFGMLFLMKMAEFKSSSGGGRTAYAVRTILVSRWLPNVSENTLAEAQRILGGVFSRLRIWVRGYLTLVVIDSTVYTVLFGILDLPCFPVLGIIAGCGILLPYIGPILACCTTLLVTYLAGDPAMGQLIAILCCYLIYNGIIEQFILYPMVIGESLGLTTLETIIVVLLGAIFAGIPGMILALPAASIIKYLVPQIYRCWDVVIKGDSPESELPRA